MTSPAPHQPDRVRVLATACAALVLAATYAFNPLGAHGFPAPLRDRGGASAQSHANFDIDSDLITRNYLAAKVAGKPMPYGELGFRIEGQITGERLGESSPYLSNANLQGRLLAPVARLAGTDFLPICRLFAAALLSLCTALWGAWCWREFGPRSAVASWLAGAFSTGSVMFGVSLYWLGFLWLLPMLTAAWLYPLRPGSPSPSAWQWLRFGLVLAVALTARWLAGFEFMTNALAAVAVPVVYYELRAGSSLRGMLTRLFAVMALGVVTFAAAFWATLVLVSEVTGSVQSALAHFSGRMETWSKLQGQENSSHAVAMLIAAAKLTMINAFSFIGPVALPIAVAYLAIAAAQARLLWTWRKSAGRRLGLDDFRAPVTALFVASLFAAAASLAWPLLRFSHIAFHPRYAHFMLFMPWGLVAAGLFGAVWQRAAGQAKPPA